MTTDAAGDGSFDVTLPGVVTALGQYVTATATNAAGSTSEFSAAVRLSEVPVAQPGGPYSVDEGGTLMLDAVASYDPDGSIAKYEWDLDYDGVAFQVEATGRQALFDASALDGPSSRTVALRVIDDGGLRSATGTAIVNIANVAPTIALSGDANVAEGSVYRLTLGPVTDPGQDAVAEYRVRWGDGQLSAYSVPGVVEHTYDDGTIDRRIQVDLVDDDGTHAGAGTLTVTVNNVPPTVTVQGPAIAVRGESLAFDLAAFDASPADAGSQFTYVIDWGDGKTDTFPGLQVAQATHKYSQLGTFEIQTTPN